MNLLNEKRRRCTELDPVCTENADADLNSATRFQSERADFGPVVIDLCSRKAKSGNSREGRVYVLARDRNLATCTFRILDIMSVRPSPTTAITVYTVTDDGCLHYDADAKSRAFRIRIHNS